MDGIYLQGAHLPNSAKHIGFGSPSRWAPEQALSGQHDRLCLNMCEAHRYILRHQLMDMMQIITCFADTPAALAETAPAGERASTNHAFFNSAICPAW